MATVNAFATEKVVNDILNQRKNEDLPIDLSCHDRGKNKAENSTSTAESVKLTTNKNSHVSPNEKISPKERDFAVKAEFVKNEPFEERFSLGNSFSPNNLCKLQEPNVKSLLNESNEKNYNHTSSHPSSPENELSSSICSSNNMNFQTCFGSTNISYAKYLQTACSEMMQGQGQSQHQISYVQELLSKMSKVQLESLFSEMKSSFAKSLQEKYPQSFPKQSNHFYELKRTLPNLLSSTSFSQTADEIKRPSDTTAGSSTNCISLSQTVRYPHGYHQCRQELINKIMEQRSTNFLPPQHKDHPIGRVFVARYPAVTHHPGLRTQNETSVFQRLPRTATARNEKNVFLRPNSVKHENKDLPQMELGEGISSCENTSSQLFPEAEHTMSHFKLQRNTMVEQIPRPVNFKPCKIVCRVCGRVYATEGALSKHRKMHDNPASENSFKCKICKKVCSTLGALRMHIRTHTLPCECHICGKAFSRTWLLQGHIRTHTGEKPYECPKCLRAFADRSNLRAHMQTHETIKRYSCQSCDKTFSRISLLKRHQRHCKAGGRDDEDQGESKDVKLEN